MASFCLYVALATIISLLNLDGTLSLKCYQENSGISDTTCAASIANPVCMKVTTYKEGRVGSIQKSCGTQVTPGELRCSNSSLLLVTTETCNCNSNWCNSAVVDRASSATAIGLVILALCRFIR